MLAIVDGVSLTRALRTTLAPELKQLLTDRIRQLDVEDLSKVARFLIVEVGDTLDTVEKELGFAIGGDSHDSFGCEWIEDHGDVVELVWILTDDGFAHVVLLTKSAGLDPELLRLCAAQA